MLVYIKDLQDELYDELMVCIEQKYEFLFMKCNGYWYYICYEEGNEYFFYCWKKENLNVEEEIMFNVNEMVEGYQIYWLF